MAAELAAEVRVEAERPAEVDLEALHPVAVGVGDDLPLQADVGDLGAGAGVGAAVEGDAQRHVEVAEALLQLADQLDGAGAGGDQRQLAELQARAGDDPAAERRRFRRQAQLVQLGEERIQLVVGDVEKHQLLHHRGADAGDPVPLGDVRQLHQVRPGHAPDDRLDAHVIEAVLLLVHANVVAVLLPRLRGGAVGKRVPEVIVLQHLPELLRAPLGDQELQAGAGAQPAVAVIAEDAAHAGPHLRHLVEGDPSAQALAQHRVGGQATADPHVETGAMLRVIHADEGHVLHLMRDVQARRTGNRRLELARQIVELVAGEVLVLDAADGRGAVDDLVGRHARHRRTEDDAGDVAATEVGVQADGVETIPNLRHVLDADPVQLDVLPVREIGRVPGEVAGNLADGANAGGGGLAAVEADAEHEVLVLEFLVGLHAGVLAAQPLLPLGVQADPLEARREILGGDGAEALLGVDVDDPLLDRESRILLLDALVVVQGFPAVDEPLALGARLAAGGCLDGHFRFLAL